MRPQLLLPLTAALALTACSNPTITIADDVNTQLSFFGPAFTDFSGVHSPYVQGAQVGLYAVVRSSTSEVDMSDWSFVSSNPSVFAVSESDPPAQGQVLNVAGFAASHGDAVIRLVDGSGNTVASTTLEVRVPDAVKIEAHGPLIIGESDNAAEVTTPQLVAGGATTFLIRWFAAGIELSGNGALSTTAVGVTATPRTSEYSVERDWLTLEAPATPGPASVAISAGGAPVTTLSINVVDESAVAQISMLGEDESRATRDDWLAVLALATDSAGAPIFGANYSFEVDGEAQDGLGDIYRYQYEPGVPKTLVAQLGSMQSTATIHAGTGYVDSDNAIGCSSSGPAGTAELVTLLGIAALAMRKRRSPLGRLPLDG